MNEKRIAMTVEEAARLLRENPSLTYRQAIAKAREMIMYEDITAMDKAKKAN